MSDLFNPIEFGFEDFGRSQHGHTYRNKYVDIRRVDGYVRTRKGGIFLKSSHGSITATDVWKIKFIGENSYIYSGVIPNKKFAFELLSNLDSLEDSFIAQFKRDLSLENLLS